jgi:Na+-driven multidrug efflux pump
MVGSIRGMGTSVAPMIVSIAGICGFRMIWILGIFPFVRLSVENIDTQYAILFMSYAISWTITLCLQLLVYKKTYNKLKIKFTTKEKEQSV